MDFEIRVPRVEDAEELGALHVRAWQEAYAGLMPDDFLAALDPEPRVDLWRRVAQKLSIGEHEGPDTRIAVDRASGRIAGFCSVGLARDDDPPIPLQLWAINILRDFYGTGAAQQLVESTLGDRLAYLWVVEGNARAIAFYRKIGFEPDGGRDVHEATGAAEVRLVRR